MRKSIPGLIIGLALAGFLGFGLLSADTPWESLQVRPEEGSPSEPHDWPAILAHHNFVLHSFDGHELPEKDPEGAPRMWPNLSFGQWPEVMGRLCNHFRGTAEVTAQGRLKIFAAATRMMCLEESLNQVENIFQQITASGAEFGLSPDSRVLTLSGDGHFLVFHLRDYVE
jgi:heat shock protein HslJ